MKQSSIKNFFTKTTDAKPSSNPPPRSPSKKDKARKQSSVSDDEDLDNFEPKETMTKKAKLSPSKSSPKKLSVNKNNTENTENTDKEIGSESESDMKPASRKFAIESSDEEESKSPPVKEEPELTKEKKQEIEVAHSLVTENEEKPSLLSANSKTLKYADLCKCFEQVEKTTKRLEITKILTNFLIEIIQNYPDQLVEVIYLCINRIAPDYEGLELKIGESILLKAIAQATGNKEDMIKTKYQKVGDLGQLAYDCRKDQKTLFKPKELMVNEVFKTYRDIASITGHSSMKLKINKIVKMLVSCRDQEAKFLMRSLNESLRIGLAEKTVLTSLAQASILYNKKKNQSTEKLEKQLVEAAEIIKSVYSEIPNYEMIIPIILEHGIEKLPEYCKLTAGIPVKPMLAHPTKSITEVLNRFENTPFTCEYKYDGERAQIHKDEKGNIKIYSRNAEDSTPKYPDVLEEVANFTKPNTTTFILDCEAVAWDSEKKELLPFHDLTRRKRKDVQIKDITIKVCLFAFDLLHLNDKCLLRTPLEERRKLLFEHFQEVTGVFTFAKSMVSDEVEEISEFLDQSIRDKCEGLMVKVLQGDESSYEPSKRSRNWLKVKKDYMTSIGDTLDLVVIGAYYGKGKRVNTYGKYLLACYNEKDEAYQTICKIGTGFTDADLQNHFNELQPVIISQPRPSYVFSSEKAPDIWFEPRFVWEVKAADLSISPIYKAGLDEVESGKGISLRFPRFIQNRDKKPEDASESTLVVDMYKNQSILQSNNDKQTYADDDFEY